MPISPLRVSILPLLFLGFVAASCRDSGAPNAALPPQITRIEALSPQQEPVSDALWTSTNEIRALQLAPGGVWAATAGGVGLFDGKTWTKWTRKNGLPSNEALAIEAKNGEITARFPTASATWSGGKWNVETAPVFAPVSQKMSWKNRPLTVTLEGLKWGDSNVALPPESTGTHITGIVPQKNGTLLTAIYGDGLWNFDGARWARAFAVPESAREITALAGDGNVLWMGTRRAGIFRRQNEKWTPFSTSDEPFSHNIQALSQFQGVLWASTLDDGLICRSGAGWRHFSTPLLSSSAPRQMTVWKNRLYVRHGGGAVDSFDGINWTKGDLADIPRKGIYALAGDETRLYAAGWGGWSEWDGQSWKAHFDIAELQGVPVLGILPDEDCVWIATQSRGLGRWNRQSGEFRWFDERDGLSDDWITALAKIDGKIYAGTFVGGLARLDGEKWHVFPALRGLNVTAIEADGQGGARAATRHGLWKISGEKAEKETADWLDNEQQALLATKTGVWVGTRTSLSFLAAK